MSNKKFWNVNILQIINPDKIPAILIHTEENSYGPGTISSGVYATEQAEPVQQLE